MSDGRRLFVVSIGCPHFVGAFIVDAINGVDALAQVEAIYGLLKNERCVVKPVPSSVFVTSARFLNRMIEADEWHRELIFGDR